MKTKFYLRKSCQNRGRFGISSNLKLSQMFFKNGIKINEDGKKTYYRPSFVLKYNNIKTKKNTTPT